MTTTTTRSEGWANAQPQTFRNLASPQHPLEPLTAAEIKTAVAILRRDKQLGKTVRFPSVTLKEPDKQAVFNFEERGKRLSQALCWVRSSSTDNGYARPIEGVIPVVDLNTMEVIRVEDYGVVPLPPESGNYAAEFIDEFRQDLKPLEITQPQGTSFEIQGHFVRWQKWQFRIGFTPREGLVLYTIGYEDGDR